jgi:hypothetical protein
MARDISRSAHQSGTGRAAFKGDPKYRVSGMFRRGDLSE